VSAPPAPAGPGAAGYATGRLLCPRDGTVVAAEGVFDGCPTCAAAGVASNVHPEYALPAGAGLPLADGEPGIFRYRALLPVGAATPVSLGEGGTPMVRLTHLAEESGADVLLKDESRNPTWSWKDRLAAVAVTRARDRGADTVVVATTGNHGAATAAYAAAAGMRCVALTLAGVPQTMKTLMQVYGASVVALPQPADRWHLMRMLVAQRGWEPLSGYCDPPIGSNPFGVDGYKSIAYEIADELGAVPDVVVVPTSYGDGLAGILRGFEDLLALGVTERLPRMVAVDPLGAYQAALAAGRPSRVAGRPTLAFSIATTIATEQGLSALRRSNGTAVGAVDDDRLTREQFRLAAASGLYLENASVAAVVACRDLAAQGWVRPGETVVALGTSTGLKDVGATAAALPEVPLISPDVAALDAALATEPGRGTR
jgi:threonine synthase